MTSKRTAELSRKESAASSPTTSRESSKAPSPSESKAQVDFQFLNFSHPSEAKASRARKTVRSHVTRQQHQREHAAAAARRAKSSPQPGDDRNAEEQLTLRQHASTFPSEQPKSELLEPPAGPSQSASSPEASSQSPSPISSPSHLTDRPLNPAELYPGEWQPYLPRLVEQYRTHIALDNPYLDGSNDRGLFRSKFYSLCITEPASLHALMLMALMHYYRTQGSRLQGIDNQQLRDMVFREINSALQDANRRASDQVISAVALMAWYECLSGDRVGFQTHMNGLTGMVNIRGGLEALGLDGMLACFLLWIDANASSLLGTERHFGTQGCPSTIPHPQPDLQRFTIGLVRQRTP